MPSDRFDWSVHADELQAAGDPWGQRIALWIAREAASPSVKRKLSKELAAREDPTVSTAVSAFTLALSKRAPSLAR